MRRLKLIGWFVWDHWLPITAFLIGTALFIFIISPVVEALVTAIMAAID